MWCRTQELVGTCLMSVQCALACPRMGGWPLWTGSALSYCVLCTGCCAVMICRGT